MKGRVSIMYMNTKKELNLKNLLLLFLALVVLFIPTYIAITSYYINKKDSPGYSSSTVMEITDPDGRKYSYTAGGGDESKEMFAIFESTRKSSSSAASLPASISGTDFLLVTYTTDYDDPEIETKTESYQYYFSTDSSACYYKDPDGKTFKIAGKDAESFLSSNCAIYLYKDAAPPVLTVSGDKVIRPSQLNWYYLSVGNEYKSFTDSGTNSESLSYDVGNTLDFKFSTDPGVCTLKVYNGSELLYDGAYNNLGSLDLKRNSNLTFNMQAEWPKTDGCQYYGSANYVFGASITAPAEFVLGQSEIYQGEFAVIGAVNITDISGITFNCSPALNYNPVFYSDGAFTYALIPVSYGLSTGEYTITIGYGVTTQTLNLKVNSFRYGYKDSNLSVSKALIDSCYSPEDIAEYNELVKKICTQPEYSVATGRYFSGAFLDYQNKNLLTAAGAKLVLGFGRNVKLTNATGMSFEHTGIDFEVDAGVDVPVMNKGKVVYTGNCDVLGTFVVVDHGLGLKSWYAHLSSVSVAVGDTLTSGQIIGKTGKTGLTLDKRLHIGLTVGEVPVAPYALWENSVVIPTFG